MQILNGREVFRFRHGRLSCLSCLSAKITNVTGKRQAKTRRNEGCDGFSGTTTKPTRRSSWEERAFCNVMRVTLSSGPATRVEKLSVQPSRDLAVRRVGLLRRVEEPAIVDGASMLDARPPVAVGSVVKSAFQLRGELTALFPLMLGTLETISGTKIVDPIVGRLVVAMIDHLRLQSVGHEERHAARAKTVSPPLIENISPPVAVFVDPRKGRLPGKLPIPTVCVLRIGKMVRRAALPEKLSGFGAVFEALAKKREGW